MSLNFLFATPEFRGLLAAVEKGEKGILKPLSAPADLERSFLSIEVGRAMDRDDLLRTLSEYGYSREDLIASPGEYAWRGGPIGRSRIESGWEKTDRPPYNTDCGRSVQTQKLI